MQIDVGPGDRVTVLIHYYRAMVGRADVWRTRMDSTTNWAIITTAGVISFTYGDRDVPHYVVFISTLLTASFLLLEARRLTFHRFWQRRVRLLERTLLRSALHDDPSADPAWGPEQARLLALLEKDLGHTVPEMPLARAVARRLRRIYLYLFGVQLIAWALKLASHPEPAATFRELVGRAHVGPLSGPVAVSIVAAMFVLGLLVALVLGRIQRSDRDAVAEVIG